MNTIDAETTRRPGACRPAATMAWPSIWLPSTTGRRQSLRAAPDVDGPSPSGWTSRTSIRSAASPQVGKRLMVVSRSSSPGTASTSTRSTWSSSKRDVAGEVAVAGRPGARVEPRERRRRHVGPGGTRGSALRRRRRRGRRRPSRRRRRRRCDASPGRRGGDGSSADTRRSLSARVGSDVEIGGAPFALRSVTPQVLWIASSTGESEGESWNQSTSASSVWWAARVATELPTGPGRRAAGRQRGHRPALVRRGPAEDDPEQRRATGWCPGADLARYLSEQADAYEPESLPVQSARNRFTGIVTRVETRQAHRRRRDPGRPAPGGVADDPRGRRRARRSSPATWRSRR